MTSFVVKEIIMLVMLYFSILCRIFYVMLDCQKHTWGVALNLSCMFE